MTHTGESGKMISLGSLTHDLSHKLVSTQRGPRIPIFHKGRSTAGFDPVQAALLGLESRML
eukprot:scaffold115631_cov19-Tisochrysis_lutea.AAC.2